MQTARLGADVLQSVQSRQSPTATHATCMCLEPGTPSGIRMSVAATAVAATDSASDVFRGAQAGGSAAPPSLAPTIGDAGTTVFDVLWRKRYCEHAAPLFRRPRSRLSANVDWARAQRRMGATSPRRGVLQPSDRRERGGRDGATIAGASASGADAAASTARASATPSSRPATSPHASQSGCHVGSRQLRFNRHARRKRAERPHRAPLARE